MLSGKDLRASVYIRQVVTRSRPDPGLDVALQITQGASDSDEIELPAEDLEMPSGGELDAMQMGQQSGRAKPCAKAQRGAAIGLREIPLRDDPGVEVNAQSRSSRISRMMRLGGVPADALAPRRRIRAAESGQVIAAFPLSAGTMWATTVPRFVTAISWPFRTDSSTAAKLC